MVPTLGGVHKIQILIRDLLKEFLQKIFGEEMGGVRGTQTPLCYLYLTRRHPKVGRGKPHQKGKAGGVVFVRAYAEMR